MNLQIRNEVPLRDIQLFCAKGIRASYEKRGFVALPEDTPGIAVDEVRGWLG